MWQFTGGFVAACLAGIAWGAAIVCGYCVVSMFMERVRTDRYGLDAPLIFICSVFGIISVIAATCMSWLAYLAFR